MAESGPSHNLVVRIPRTLFEDVRSRLHDPFTGRARYGAWSTLIGTLLEQWLKEHKDDNNRPRQQ